MMIASREPLIARSRHALGRMAVFFMVTFFCGSIPESVALPPEVNDDFFVEREDREIQESLFDNDRPDDNDNDLIILNVTSPSVVGARFEVDLSSGDFRYDPAPDFSGVVRFDYTVLEDDSDTSGICAPVITNSSACTRTGQVVLYFRPRADAPDFSATGAQGIQGTTFPLNMSLTPADDDGSEVVSLTLNNFPAGSVLSAGTQQADGSWVLNEADVAAAQLTPPPNFNGFIAVAYTLSSTDTALDERGEEETDTISVSGSFSVDVSRANNNPELTGNIPELTTDEDVNASVDLEGVVTDADIATNGDSLVYSVTSINSDAVASASLAGSVLSVVVVPDQNQLGGSVGISVSDLFGGVPVEFEVPLNVVAVNDDPVAEDSVPVIEMDEDSAASLDLSGYVSDVDVATNGDVLAYEVVAIDHPALVQATLLGPQLNVAGGADLFGTGTVTVRVTDQVATQPLLLSIIVNVNSVNDAPVAIGSVEAVDALEDAAPVDRDFTGVFADVDLASGDSLTLSASVTEGANIIERLTIANQTLSMVFAANANGSAAVRVEATDEAGARATYLLPVEVQAVNDAPMVEAAIPNQNVDEDAAPINVSVSGVFDDVDILTNADQLAYEVVSNSNEGLFSDISVSGETINLTLAVDAYGIAELAMVATDLAGASSDPVVFSVVVNPVDDLPDARDDVTANILEDSSGFSIDVLANDYLGDVPTNIVSIVSVGSQSFVDINQDTITTAQGLATIEEDLIFFEPALNFWGAAEFEYSIRDADGDEDVAKVTFYVEPVNDAPLAKQTHDYSVLEGSSLTVEAVDGLLLGAYDFDVAGVDQEGNPLLPVNPEGELQLNALSVVFETAPPSEEGVLTTTTSDGAFTFQPALGFVGTTSFTYSVFDGNLKSEIGTVFIEVIALPPPGEAPNPGEVSVLFNLTNTPLEQSTSVSPNVVVQMDDSGSMDWHMSINSADDGGRFVISNAQIARRGRRQSDYSYLFSLSVNAYSPTNINGRVLPSEEALALYMPGNTYEVWRARSASYNKIYYNPLVTYEPWTGLDNSGVEFADANPSAVRLDPRSNSRTYDITRLKSYTADNVPRWRRRGGLADIPVTDFYAPRYYTVSGSRVEIKNNGTTYVGGPERDDCSVSSACTYTEEIQNFANWFQYYRSRELVAKAAVGNVVAELQDIRVGYETINRRASEPIAEMNEYFWEGEKRELLDTVYSVSSSGGTPLRRALNDSGRILSCQHEARGCPALPAPEGICQQNFTLLFSDGYWNGSAPLSVNADQDGAGIFDGGKYADDYANTLADIAMYYYENDLFPAIADSVPLSTSDIDGVPAGTFASDNDLIHQHMKTFTIAFGVVGDIDPAIAASAPVSTSFPWPSPYAGPNAKVDDMLHAAVNSRGRFLNAGDPQQLQSSVGTAFREFTQAASSSSAAAFNSTSLREGTLLYRGFYDLRSRTGELTASRVSTTGEIDSVPIWTAARLLDADSPSGQLPSQRVIFTFDPQQKTGIPFRYDELTTDQKTTLSRNELDFLRGVRDFEEPIGGLRERLRREGLLGDIVNSSPVFVGEARAINRDQPPFPTDDLYSDFAVQMNTRQKMVYVGANDGMLHGFDALTGTEVMAYVPNLILDNSLPYGNKLDSFTSPFYLHDYFVDLTPRLNDVYIRASRLSDKSWLTTLVGGLGAGGKGVFALNVTDPANQFSDEASAKTSVLWEFTEADDSYPLDLSGEPLGGAVGALVDASGEPIKDMGYSLSLPVITMTNRKGIDGENQWVAIFGNGTNSTSGIATLFVLDMDKGIDGWQSGDFVKISTGYGVPLPGEQLEGYPNALGSPAAIDQNLDGTVDLVYAGDRMGHLYRFDMRSENPDDWRAIRLFSATYAQGGTDVVQPILSQPLVVKHPEKEGFLITFGTGSFITEGDGSNQDIQSIYTIWDSLISSPRTALADSKATRLVKQTLSNVVDDSVAPAQTRRVLSSEPVPYASESTSPGVYGWYIDLNMERASTTRSGALNNDISGLAPPSPQFPGEKAIRRFLYRDGAIVTTTVLPATNATSCFGSRPGALLILDALTGGNPDEPIVDFNEDGYVDESDLLEVEGTTYSAGWIFDQSQLDGQLVDLSTLGGQDDTDFLFICGGNDCISRKIRDLKDTKTGRLSWTELRRD